MKSLNSEKSFTLLELLIVIGILAILAAAAVVVLNPIELLRQARDSTRIVDLKNLDKTLAIYQVEGGSSFGAHNTVYVSIPDSSPTCANLGLPSLSSGWSYACSNSDNYRKVDGSGWLPVNFNSISIGSPLAALPVDPINSASTGNYYTYVTGSSWALAGMLESEKYLKQSALNDAGTDDGRLEIGTNLNLWTQASGLVGYWKFDEGSGTTANDSSGNNNNGALTNGPTWTMVGCKISNCLDFNLNQYIQINYNTSFNAPNSFTLLTWFKPVTFPNVGALELIRGPSYENYSWRVLSNGYHFVGAKQGGFWTTLIIGGNYTDATTNQWKHIAITYLNSSGVGGKLYADGVLRSFNNAVGALTTGSGNPGIGALSIGANTVGRIVFDEVRIYNRALSDAEIQAIYNATK